MHDKLTKQQRNHCNRSTISHEYFKDLTFDNIYHRQYNYWSLTSLTNFFDKLGVKIFRSEKIDTHGGSIKFILKKIKKLRLRQVLKKCLKKKKIMELKNLQLTKNLEKKFMKLERCNN